MKRKPNLQIYEIFLVRATESKTYAGQVISEEIVDSKPVVRGTTMIDEGRIWSAAKSLKQLKENLKVMCGLKLDYALNDDYGKVDVIAGTSFFLN